MNRRLVVGVLLAVGAIALLSVFAQRPTGASVFSRQADGLKATMAYLEARGAEVDLRDRPFGVDEDLGVAWWIALPAPKPLDEDEIVALRARLAAGGTIVVSYDDARTSLVRRQIFDAVGVGSSLPIRQEAPSGWRAWGDWAEARWSLEPVAPFDSPPLRIHAIDRAPPPPPDARRLYRGGDDAGDAATLVFAYRRGAGTVWMIPSAAVRNAGVVDNAALLDLLLETVGRRWSIDEYRHGLVDLELAAAGSAGRRAWDFFLAHLALAYALAALGLAWRFGPPWREERPSFASTAAFLRGLGSVHDRLGHHGDAAEALVERARALDPRLSRPPAELTDVHDGAGLLRLARSLARRRAASSRSLP
ncbi:MAG: hypothetical protein AAGN46_02750 [Acidobacteriota bacterium]